MGRNPTERKRTRQQMLARVAKKARPKNRRIQNLALYPDCSSYGIVQNENHLLEVACGKKCVLFYLIFWRGGQIDGTTLMHSVGLFCSFPFELSFSAVISTFLTIPTEKDLFSRTFSET